MLDFLNLQNWRDVARSIGLIVWQSRFYATPRLVHAALSPSTERMVLFVCVENTFRSILSEAIFNAHAPPGWRAESAGVQPATEINPLAVELLSEVGIHIAGKTPRLVTRDMVSRAWRVVTFGCLDRCPIGAEGKAEDWQVPTSTGKSAQELRAIRDELNKRVLSLIEEIKRLPSP